MWQFEGRGRRTGLQLAATEQRDEWGMEPLESLPFSPDPEDSRDDIDNRDFQIAQPFLGDAYSREMDISEESPLLAWPTRPCSPKSTSVDPLPAAAGYDAETSGDIYECVERSSPVSRGESQVVEEEEVFVQPFHQLIRPDQHNAVSQPCLQDNGNATDQPRKRGKPRKLTRDSNTSQGPQKSPSSSNMYESSRQNPRKQIVRSSYPVPSSEGRQLRIGRARGQKFANRSIQQKVRTKVKSDVTITRSGRMSIPPISTWRGDKIVEGKEVVSDTGKQDRFVVPTVREVIRAPENIVESSNDKARKKRRGGGKNSTQEGKIMQQEEWEMILGRKSVACRLQQSENGDDASDGGVSAYCDLDVAFSSDRILGLDCPKNRVHWEHIRVHGFIPFGFMNLPAGTNKAHAKAKTNNNIFFVHTGKVRVTVNKKPFKVTAGSAFTVPKGNQYSISNPSRQTSLIFYVIDTSPDTEHAVYRRESITSLGSSSTAPCSDGS